MFWEIQAWPQISAWSLISALGTSSSYLSVGSYGAKKVPKRSSYTVQLKLKAVVAAKMKSREAGI